jgi:hypothetical protein
LGSSLCFFVSHHSDCDFHAVLYTVEFQKHGLPHGHILFWVSIDTSEPSPQFIDSFITVEIPDPAVDPLAYALVAEDMVHGLCGRYNPKCSCMKDEKCSKNYPKEFSDTTIVDENGVVVDKSLITKDLLLKAV